MAGVISAYDMANIAREGRKRGIAYVMPIGTFNPPRRHHGNLFREASEHGIVIVVANTDDSVSLYRNGNGRGDFIFPFAYRAALVSQFPHVTYIVPFCDVNAAETIRVIKPNQVWKGPDYTLESINRSEFLEGTKIAEELGVSSEEYFHFASVCEKETFDMKQSLRDYRRWAV